MYAAPSKHKEGAIPRVQHDAAECMRFSSYSRICAGYTALGFSKEDIKFASEHDPRGVMVFKGGETPGLHRIQEYIFDNDCLKVAQTFTCFLFVVLRRCTRARCTHVWKWPSCIEVLQPYHLEVLMST